VLKTIHDEKEISDSSKKEIKNYIEEFEKTFN